jgi:O-antigen/teichoic acid export membrane protein
MVSSIWTALITFAVVPIYLRYLGIEAYGLIGFYATIQTIFLLLDLGLAPTINREIARNLASGDTNEAQKLLHTMAVIYWSMASLGTLIIILLAPLISEHWLQLKYISQQTVYHALCLMALTFAFRFPSELYQSALIGMQRLVTTSIINICTVSLANLGGIFVLAYVSPDIEFLFIWQATCGLIHTLVMRRAAWIHLRSTNEPLRFRLAHLKQTWKFATSISLITLSAIALSQFDKLLLSKLLSLPDFGLYILATNVVGGLYVFVSPFFRSMYPRFSTLVALGDNTKLTELYNRATWLLASLIFPVSIILVFFPYDLLYAWTGNHEISLQTAPLVRVMALGSVLHAVMHLPYAIQLAFGMPRLPLKINGLLLLIMPPLTYILASSFGTIGGAISWLIFNLLYFTIGIYLTHRHILRGVAIDWIVREVLPPFVSSMAIGSIGALFVLIVQPTSLQSLGLAFSLIATAMITSLLTSRHRWLLLSWLRRFIAARRYGGEN